MNRAGLAYWGLLLVTSVRVGFSGALSTVSTLVAEVGHTVSLFHGNGQAAVHGCAPEIKSTSPLAVVDCLT